MVVHGLGDLEAPAAEVERREHLHHLLVALLGDLGPGDGRVLLRGALGRPLLVGAHLCVRVAQAHLVEGLSVDVRATRCRVHHVDDGPAVAGAVDGEGEVVGCAHGLSFGTV